MSRCHGQGPDHCCVFEGRDCEFLLEGGQVAGRRWACGLYVELGSWEAVRDDPRWQNSPGGRWFADHHPGHGCGDWPQALPEVMEDPGAGLCCFSEAASG